MNPEQLDTRIRDLEKSLRDRPNETARTVQRINDELDRDLAAIQNRRQRDVDALHAECDNEIRIRRQQAQNSIEQERLRESNDTTMLHQNIRNARDARAQMRQPVGGI